MDRSPRSLTMLVTVAALLFLSAAPAAAQYPLPTPTSTGALPVSTTAPQVGGRVAVSGQGFCPNSTVRAVLVPSVGTPIQLATFVADAQGRFAGEVTIPANIAPGTYDLQSQGTASNCVTPRVLGARISVQPAAALQVTGANVLPWAIAALGAIALGGVLIAVARRRRPAG